MYSGIYRNNRVFITGHTGFKGSWLTAYLSLLGAEIAGFSQNVPTQPAHFTLLKPNLCRDLRGDVNDFNAVKQAVADFAPDILFHLAAQPIVRRSYDFPLQTFQTNILGTANVLEAALQTPSVRAVIVITTDKCYINRNENTAPFVESDTLGGSDPYSASKACAEIIADSYRQRTDIPLATCRSGNAIGGGDWAVDRLMPNMMRSVNGEPMKIRMPEATRPWQFVLEPLHGYLLLGKKMLDGKTNDRQSYGECWNFGPALEDNVSVKRFAELTAKCWDKIRCETETIPDESRREAALLMLDSSKAHRRLHWQPVWSLEQSIAETVRWYRDFDAAGTVRTQEQIEMYLSRCV